MTLPHLTFRILPLLVVIWSTSGCGAVRWLETVGQSEPDQNSGLFQRVFEGLRPCQQDLTEITIPRPVENALITSPFDIHRILNGEARPHYGTDFGAPAGTAIIAIADGIIQERETKGGYGKFIKIDHGHGYNSRYGHLSDYAGGVSVGDCVRQGDVIGYVGSTGRSTGPHLHLEIRKDDKAMLPSDLGLDWRREI